MLRNRVAVGVVLLAAGLGPAGVWADGFRNPPDTAASLGKAGNHMVWVDDASAVFLNPANLTEVASRQVQLSALVGYSHADFSSDLLGRTETERPWSFLPAFALAWPLAEQNLALGLGLHVPYGRQTRWEADGALRGLTPTHSQMSVAELTPSLAWKVSETLSVGAGLDLYYGRLRFSQRLPLPFPPASRVDAETEGFAVGGNVGLAWQPAPRHRFALTYRSPFDLTFEGDMETEALAPLAAPRSDVETTFNFPTIVALGYGFKVTETLSLEAKVEWLEFSRFKNMKIDAGANNAFLGLMGLSSTPQNWKDTWTFGLGADWRFAPAWSLRAGYLYLQSPIPDDTFAPTALDVDQSVVSVGLGYQSGAHAVDLAYAIGLFKTRRVEDNQTPFFQQSTYDFEGHLAALTYTYSF